MLRRALFTLAPLFLVACGGGDGGPTTPSNDVASVSVSPAGATLVPQQTTELSAVPRNASGSPVPGSSVTWTSEADGIASVSGTGSVLGLSPGTATIRATSQGRSGTATITVLDGGFVGPGGGTVQAASGAVRIEVPAGALGTGTALTVSTLGSPPAHPELIPGTGYTLGPNGTTFAEPVTVTLSWDEGDLPLGTEVSELRVHRHDGSGWVLLSDGAVDPVTRTASGTTTTFSPFAILEVVMQNPTPVLTSILPDEAVAGSPGFTLDVTGSGFIEGSEVLWNGEVRPTTFVSATALQAAVSADDLVSEGMTMVSVLNPAPGGGTSGSLPFVVTAPPFAESTSVSSGDEHTCGVSNSGVATCWGNGEAGQLGSGAETFLPMPVRVAGSHTFAEVSPGGSHTCAIDDVGAALCWGLGSTGRLGDGGSGDRPLPGPVSGGLTFASLSANANHTCGLTPAGTAYCWGSGLSGQLGDGPGGSSGTTPGAVTGGHTFTAISTGLSHTCAIAEGGAAWCWGGNNSGELGDGSTASTGTPVPVAGGLTFASVSAGSSFTCALTPEGQAYCWGTNSQGTLGNGGLVSSSTPVAVSGGHTFTKISAGGQHACGLDDSSAVLCWGWGSSGQLGNGSTVLRNTPTAVTGGQSFSTISAGAAQSCGITTGGTSLCWGRNTEGQLGDGTTDSRDVPVEVLGSHAFIQIEAGTSPFNAHSCGLTGAGEIYCWGHAARGQLGDGSAAIRFTPGEVAGGLNFLSISAGWLHSCGVSPGGEAYCWGNGQNGEIGNGASESEALPQLVSGGHDFSVVSAGGSHSCGLDSEGRAFCWGLGTLGRLGNGANLDRDTPAAVTGDLRFLKISAGSDHTCGITEAGAAHCWGRGHLGQLGHGATPSSLTTPVPVAGGHSFIDIAAGNLFTCGVTDGGQALCWGAGAAGRLGTGSEANHNTPEPVVGDLDFASVTAGGIGTRGHACGVTVQGNAHCWGRNFSGQLGSGFFSPHSLVPLAVVGGIDFARLSAGTNHTCGISTNGVTYCWGDGSDGRLGNGSANNRSMPIGVAAP